jgi:hypothetical protein
MTSPSKAKGSSFEREVAKYLSDLYQESFIRAPGSGAYIGGKNQSRKQYLDEGQIRSFKGDIVPGATFTKFNAECKNYGDFPFHLLFTGDCKVLESWIEQLMAVAEDGDMNIIFMKFNRKGRFVVVPADKTWVTDQFFHYTSNHRGDWIIINFEHFFKHNKDLLKAYSGSPNTNIDTMSTPNVITLNT